MGFPESFPRGQASELAGQWTQPTKGEGGMERGEDRVTKQTPGKKAEIIC